jgi:hypothetical protein
MPGENTPTDADATDRTDAVTTDADATDRTDAVTSNSDGAGGGETAPATAAEHVENAVPEDRTAHRCPYCDRPFAAADRVTLHVGLTHYDVCTDAEAEAFEEAYLAENQAIKRYRLKAAAVLILVYFGFLMIYAVFGVAG